MDTLLCHGVHSDEEGIKAQSAFQRLHKLRAEEGCPCSPACTGAAGVAEHSRVHSHADARRLLRSAGIAHVPADLLLVAHGSERAIEAYVAVNKYDAVLEARP
jgi:hypothetical protein